MRLMPNDLLTAAEAADVLGVSVATVHRLAAEDVLPTAIKAPGLRGPRWFERAAVEAVAKARGAA